MCDCLIINYYFLPKSFHLLTSQNDVAVRLKNPTFVKMSQHRDCRVLTSGGKAVAARGPYTAETPWSIPLCAVLHLLGLLRP